MAYGQQSSVSGGSRDNGAASVVASGGNRARRSVHFADLPPVEEHREEGTSCCYKFWLAAGALSTFATFAWIGYGTSLYQYNQSVLAGVAKYCDDSSVTVATTQPSYALSAWEGGLAVISLLSTLLTYWRYTKPFTSGELKRFSVSDRAGCAEPHDSCYKDGNFSCYNLCSFLQFFYVNVITGVTNVALATHGLSHDDGKRAGLFAAANAESNLCLLDDDKRSSKLSGVLQKSMWSDVMSDTCLIGVLAINVCVPLLVTFVAYRLAGCQATREQAEPRDAVKARRRLPGTSGVH